MYLKCSVYITNSNSKVNMKFYKKIFKPIECSDDEYIKLYVKPRSAVLGIDIKTSRFAYFAQILRQLANSDSDIAPKNGQHEVLLQLLFAVFCGQCKKYRVNEKQYTLVLNIEDLSDTNDWMIYRSMVQVYSMKSTNMGRMQIQKPNKLLDEGVVGFDYEKMCLAVEKFKNPDIKNLFLNDTMGTYLVLLYNIGVTNEDCTIIMKDNDGTEYLVKSMPIK